MDRRASPPCDIYDFADGKLAAITSYAVELRDGNSNGVVTASAPLQIGESRAPPPAGCGLLAVAGHAVTASEATSRRATMTARPTHGTMNGIGTSPTSPMRGAVDVCKELCATGSPMCVLRR